MALELRELVLKLVRQNYCEFGPMLAAEVLLEHHGVKVSSETLRKWLVKARSGRVDEPRLRYGLSGQG